MGLQRAEIYDVIKLLEREAGPAAASDFGRKQEVETVCRRDEEIR